MKAAGSAAYTARSRRRIAGDGGAAEPVEDPEEHVRHDDPEQHEARDKRRLHQPRDEPSPERVPVEQQRLAGGKCHEHGHEVDPQRALPVQPAAGVKDQRAGKRQRRIRGEPGQGRPGDHGRCARVHRAGPAARTQRAAPMRRGYALHGTAVRPHPHYTAPPARHRGARRRRARRRGQQRTCAAPGHARQSRRPDAPRPRSTAPPIPGAAVRPGGMPRYQAAHPPHPDPRSSILIERSLLVITYLLPGSSSSILS